MNWLTGNRLIAVMLLAGSVLLGQGTAIKAKAWLAQQLIAMSWDTRPAGAEPSKPWPWADTRVVARLVVPNLNIEQFVMADASGESLAFGPGSVMFGQLPATSGASVIAGHRDTHFRFLDQLEPGTRIEVENYRGQRRLYTVSTRRVVNSEDSVLEIDPDQAGLTLVTCWPFDAIVPGGPLRYLVQAEPTGTLSAISGERFGDQVAALRNAGF